MTSLPRTDPMLATPGPLPPPSLDDAYAYEVKQDGQRCMAYLPGDGTVLLRSRSGSDITAAYPDLSGLGEALGPQAAVLDGEIIAPDREGRADFQRLQSRMGLVSSPARAARMAAKVSAHLVLFDIVHLDAEDLTRTAYTGRRTILESLSLHGANWSTPAAVTGHGQQALERTRSAGLEGLVAKRLTSTYQPGIRSRAWIKIRNVKTADIVVGGWLPGQGRLTSLPGALLMGQPGPDGLHFVGSVGTGWTDAARTHLASLLAGLETRTCPFTRRPAVTNARWVMPCLVAEVRYTTRTQAGRLRQPSWHRLRPDLAFDDLQ
ncbi:ATP-dependent DNA ligase [Streptomyces sp. CB04723]|uniref:non-homologous end-joining DNA ligase n=1 Tax=Streptomyces TaxID=1883 RepID=UPI0015C45A66|nr:non-homologous end-joining DNA ligase [Streptomyces sp. CB04723]QLG31356.1 ATP-dependent DNA ligase [Streptomyces sp. CB04723]